MNRFVSLWNISLKIISIYLILTMLEVFKDISDFITMSLLIVSGCLMIISVVGLLIKRLEKKHKE